VDAAFADGVVLVFHPDASTLLVVVHFEKWLILVPLYSVLSVYSVVLAGKNNHGIHL